MLTGCNDNVEEIEFNKTVSAINITRLIIKPAVFQFETITYVS